jgi:hypothetical protein
VMALIHELLPKAMVDIGAIGKTQRNEAQHWDFRGITDFLNACQPSLTKYGIIVSFVVMDYGVDVSMDGQKRVCRATLRMMVTFTAADGSCVENISAGEALDYNGDKATNKAMAAAFKYALAFGLCIPVDRLAIPDADSEYSYTEPQEEVRSPEQQRIAKVTSCRKSPIARTMVLDPPADTGEHPQEAVSLYAKAEAKIANAMTIEDLSKCQERINTLVRSGDFTAADSKKLGAKINARAKQLNGTEKATA